jgi:type II secretory pathway component GspD/PulD (secretin)
MKRITIYLCLIVFILISGTGILRAQENKSDLDVMYMKAINSYYAKNYSESITIFKEIQGINPSYRASQVNRYIRRAETQLGKLGVKKAFKPGEHETTEVEVVKEGELETLSKAAQKVLLDAYAYIQESGTKYRIQKFDMMESESTLRMAKEAYGANQFTEAIRLANKARLQMEQYLQKKAEIEKPVLGELGTTPITLNLNGADLEQTLKLIYDLTGANIILSKGITGRVTINVKDIPLQKVLDLICEANKLKYIEEEKVVKIMTEEEYNNRAKAIKEQSRRVFNVFYGDASLIAKSLRETFKMDNIVHDPRTNSIIVDVNNPALLQQIQDVVYSLDIPISQVMLEAKIVEVSTSGESLFSIDWLISSRMIESIGTVLTGPRFGVTPTYTPGSSSTLPSGFSFGLTNKDVNSLISALATQGEVKLIQSPKIMCLNGTSAVISVVQNFPYIIPEYQQTYNPTTGALTGSQQTVTVYEEEVGTEFEVTPIIQRNRTVFLTLNIYDSRLVEVRKLSAVAAGLTYETEQPIISSRETTQNVTLFDGQTLIVGGMIQQREEKSETGIPFLRKIPLLGFLFRKPEYSKTSDELLLFLTPYVVTTYQEAVSISDPDIKKSKHEIDAGLLEKF